MSGTGEKEREGQSGRCSCKEGTRRGMILTRIHMVKLAAVEVAIGWGQY